MADWKHFERSEFTCQCGCGTNEIESWFVDDLERIRIESGIPMKVTSGYRCPDHPIEVEKDAPGPHAEGLAADISVSHTNAFMILKAAIEVGGITGIGVQQKGAGRILHLDHALAAPGRPRPHIWSY